MAVAKGVFCGTLTGGPALGLFVLWRGGVLSTTISSLRTTELL